MSEAPTETCPRCGTPFTWRRKWNSGDPKDLLLPDCDCEEEDP
jgi:hypothetical protein